ncbi:uncharacterized protein LOC6530753 [Drosophila yakuba]|uniref:Uncharacterized protein n=1 Tax=Drosophila yakuba TaxID=7245 RepID=B4PA24_DROYA|nr:uncharacterized protein LOC6530753 [Drosophila yakuba]EDW91355.1 uncharacterized protein Dyak_GE12136 [Drosophila yakuba]
MKSFGNLTFGLLAILIACLTVGLEARRLALRPLTGRELRRALRESGFDEDSAAGRSVASALTGLSGFALGITKGIGGSILFDVVTSNVTIDYITSLLNSTASSSTSSSSGTAQEICFNSRSADGEIINGRSNGYDDDAEANGEWRQTGSGDTDTGTGTGTDTNTNTGTMTTPTTTSASNGLTCIVLSKEGSRRRRQLRIRPGTLRSVYPEHHRQTLRKYRRHRA